MRRHSISCLISAKNNIENIYVFMFPVFPLGFFNAFCSPLFRGIMVVIDAFGCVDDPPPKKKAAHFFLRLGYM